MTPHPEPRGGRAGITVLIVGVGLWVFFRTCSWLLSVLPINAAEHDRWASAVSKGTHPVVELAVTITLAGILLLIHRMERTRQLRRAAGVGVLLALAPTAALLGTGDGAGVFGLALARAVIAVVGVMAASVLVFRFGDVRTV